MDNRNDDMKTIIILAGNYKEYLNYLFSIFDKKSLDIRKWNNFTIVDNVQYIYGSRPETIQGLRADDIVCYGTFWERKDAGDLYENACCRIFVRNSGLRRWLIHFLIFLKKLFYWR